MERRGLDEVDRILAARRTAMAASGEGKRRRRVQAKAALWAEIGDALLDRFKGDPLVKTRLSKLEREVEAGKLSPAVAAREALHAFLTQPTPSRTLPSRGGGKGGGRVA